MSNKLVRFAMAGLVMLALSVPQVIAQAQGGAMAAPQKGNAMGAKGNDHPAIVKAINHLEATKQILQQHAANDFEGHKNKALKSIDEALEQLHQADQVQK
jgi:hypothetical protein